MRGALQEFLRIADSAERIRDQLLVSLRDLSSPSELLDVIPVSLGRRNSSSRGVRLLQKSGISQVRHHVPDRRWAEPVPVAASKRARADRLSSRDIGFDNGGQDLPFSGSYVGTRHVAK